jgi:PTH1 family peptidyl-tRNA hydrolase
MVGEIELGYDGIMKLIVGLGNPGKEFERTRHNVGFMIVDSLKLIVDKDNHPFINSRKHQALVFKSNNLILTKPQTFMNGSGEAVALLAGYYRISVKQLYVVHDDLDIGLGEYKIQFGKGPKIHNGINSIVKALKTDQFWRVRVGVENRTGQAKIPGKKYLLENFLIEEQEGLGPVIEKVTEELNHVI